MTPIDASGARAFSHLCDSAARARLLFGSRLHAVVAATLVAVAAQEAAVGAQGPGLDDPAFQRAAMVVTIFDAYRARCPQPPAADAATIDVWLRTNEVTLVRRRVEALAADAATRAKAGALRGAAANAVRAQQVEPCAALRAVTRTADAQFATTSPALLAALRASEASAPPAAPTPVPTSPAAVVPAPAAPAANGRVAAADVDAFAFDTAMAMGVGGFLTTRIFPVVLFKNGDALTDVEGLAFPAGLAAHRRAHPKAWTRWRRSGSQIELQEGASWSRLPFPVTYPRLPDGFRLDGTFRSLAAVGNAVVGGTQEVVAWNEYRFWPDGRVARGGGAGARGSATDASVVTAATAPNRRGTYRIDGLELVMTWADGTNERRILVTDPANPNSAIWLDGVGYPRQRP